MGARALAYLRQKATQIELRPVDLFSTNCSGTLTKLTTTLGGRDFRHLRLQDFPQNREPSCRGNAQMMEIVGSSTEQQVLGRNEGPATSDVREGQNIGASEDVNG